MAELETALQQNASGKSPGCDNIPYEALRVDLDWWKCAILDFCNACYHHACVPSYWKHGLVVPIPKGACKADRDSYRPITLRSCFAKTLERMVLNRIRPLVEPTIDDSQAGFRWGSDVQVYMLLETLKLRRGSRTYCAFPALAHYSTGRHCGAEGRHGCGAEVDAYGDHHLACPRTGLLPRRGFVVERAWVQVAREAVGPEGRVVPQHCAASPRRRPSPPRLRCLWGDHEWRGFVLRRNACPPTYPRWPTRLGGRHTGGSRACCSAPTQSRAIPGAHPRRASPSKQATTAQTASS